MVVNAYLAGIILKCMKLSETLPDNSGVLSFIPVEFTPQLCQMYERTSIIFELQISVKL